LPVLYIFFQIGTRLWQNESKEEKILKTVLYLEKLETVSGGLISNAVEYLWDLLEKYGLDESEAGTFALR